MPLHHDASRDAQAQTRPLPDILGGEERFEQARLQIDEQPLSGIAFGEQDVAGLQIDGFALSPQLLKIIRPRTD